MATNTSASRFTISVARREDQCPDLSYLGSFTRRPTFPYWDRAASEIVHNDEEAQRHEGLYFSARQHRFVHDFQSPDNDEAIEQDAQRLTTYGIDWAQMIVTVTASLDGREWGSASLGGIESDSGDAHFDEVIADLTKEATAEAQEALAAFLAKHCTHGEG